MPSLSQLGGPGVESSHTDGHVAHRQARRILVVAPEPFYQDRGTPIALRQVLEALSSLSYPVDLLTFPIGEDIELPGLRIFRVANPFGLTRVPIGLSVRKLLLDVSLIMALAARLRRERYTCIHAVEEAAFPALVLGRRHGVPLLYDMQSCLPEQLFQQATFRIPPVRWIIEALERWLVSRADLVVGSAGLAERVRHIAPETSVREWRFSSTVAEPDPAAVNSVREALRLSREQRLVLYSGTFEEYQGLTQLVQAMPLVLAEFPNSLFVLVGADAATDAEIAGNGVGRRLRESGALRIVGRQPRPVLAAYHAAADVLVSPRIYGRNLPLKVFDYLAAGRSIVATDLPSHRTVLNEERAVLVAPNAQALAGGIMEVLRDPARAARLSEAARTYAKEHLDWTAFVRGVGELYDEVHGNARGA